MFDIDASPVFTRTVTVFVPSGDSYVEQTLKATFNVLADDAVEGVALHETVRVKTALRAMVVRLDDLANAQGETVAYSESVLEQVLSLPYVRIALLKAYFEGVVVERLGN